MAIKLKNNDKLLEMAVKHRTLKRSHASALVDKNVIISTVKRASRETVEGEAKLTKDVRVATKMPTPTRNQLKTERRRHMTRPDMFSISKMI